MPIAEVPRAGCSSQTLPTQWHLPHGALDPGHLVVVSEVTEHDPAEAPSALDPSRTRGEDAAIMDPDGAAVPWQSCNLLVGNLLQFLW